VRAEPVQSLQRLISNGDCSVAFFPHTHNAQPAVLMEALHRRQLTELPFKICSKPVLHGGLILYVPLMEKRHRRRFTRCMPRKRLIMHKSDSCCGYLSAGLFIALRSSDIRWRKISHMVALNQEDTVITFVLSSRDHHPTEVGHDGSARCCPVPAEGALLKFS
jgi:hypothetical protein